MVSRPYLAGCCGLLVAVSSLAAANTPAAGKDMAQLRKKFDGMDANKDGFLDVAELARAVRDAHAQPAPKWVYDPEGSPMRSFGVAKHFYPDVLFLWSRDSDGDNRVSWEEYLEYESIYRDAAARNRRLTRRVAELLFALQNLNGRSQAANNFSTGLAGAPGGSSSILTQLSSATNPLLAGAGAGSSSLLTPSSLPQGLGAGVPNLASQLGGASFSPRVSMNGSNLAGIQLPQYDKYIATFDQRYFRRFCGYFSPGTSPAYIMQQYVAYKRRAILHYLMRIRQRSMGLP